MTMIESVQAALNTEFPEEWAAEWPHSERHLPNGWSASPPDQAFHALVEAVGLRPEIRTACVRAAAQLRENPVLWRLFRHCHWSFFGREGLAREAVAKWPAVPDAVHPGAPLFYALVLLAGIPILLQRNRMRRISDATTFETLHDLDRWILAKPGQPEVWFFNNLDWFWTHFQGRLFSLGRLQFCMEPYTFNAKGFRNRQTGALRLLFNGHPISSEGCVLPTSETLEKSLWEKLFVTGDPAISVHIPAGSPLDTAACIESFKRATPFFRTHHPEYPFRVFFTDSWLLDRSLERLLPETSNIVRFQRLFRYVPLPQADDHQMWERVFDAPNGRPSNPPSRTSLQRAILEHLRRGGRFCNGGGIRLPEGL